MALLRLRSGLGNEAIAGRIDDGEDVPPPSAARKGERTIAVPTRTAAQAALHLAMRAAGISKSALAKLSMAL
ncbi:MAG TPA: hypothetical protein VJ487_13095 [Alphaproteobacteria bacterium]|nr:hypothetical protein [Alphaproteobacteria bacterium]